ncbi:MAG TPA: DUF4160 domain-containing protein [Longimicrobium sp.]
MIYPNDHTPPHVHVYKAEASAIIDIETLEDHDVHEMRLKDLRRARQIVAEQRESLMASWREFHG